MVPQAERRETNRASKRARAAAAALVLAASFVASGVVAVPAPAPAKRVQLVAKDEPVRDVLLRLGEQSHLNVSVAAEVTGNVNLSLHDVTPDEAVHAVCMQLRLRCVREGRTIEVSTESTQVVPLAIVPAARAAQVLRATYPRVAVRVDAPANALVLSGSAADVSAARTVLTSLDVRDATKPTSEALTLRTPTAATVAWSGTAGSIRTRRARRPRR